MRTHRQSLHSVYLAAIALSPSVQAQLVIDSLSFGHQQSISPDGHAIPGWHVAGEQNGQPQSPQILSDRVVLTPPAPGHARGALWTDQPIQYPEWSVDMSFRASGPDRASGNLQIWFTKDTAPAAGLRSIYTVESFDGMALVLDQYAGSGGAVRGFLNDGNVNHKNHHNVDGLAFGHCDFSYRNLGRMSKLNMRQGGDGLEVTVDGRTCFRSNMVGQHAITVWIAAIRYADIGSRSNYRQATALASLQLRPRRQTRLRSADSSFPPAIRILEARPSISHLRRPTREEVTGLAKGRAHRRTSSSTS